MNELVILDGGSGGPLPRLLSELGAEFTTRTLGDLISSSAAGAADYHSSVIVSEAQLIVAAAHARKSRTSVAQLLSRFRRMLVYPFGGTSDGLAAFGALVGATVRVAPDKANAQYSVSDVPTLCGPFAGLAFGPANLECDRPLYVTDATRPCEWLVTAGNGGLVGRFSGPQNEIFVNASTSVFDTNAKHFRNLQAAECFASLVPLLWFIRHCGTPLSRTAGRWANWIIDDPNLSWRYGFIRLPELADAVRHAGAAVTVGFIPWNHGRTTPAIVRLFRERWPGMAICVHGCNHTASEFAVRDRNKAVQLGALALARMRQLERETGLGFEKVMVFPQGRFSAVAMSALQELNLLAAVNTEVVDAATGAGVRGGDLLRPALTCYGGLPIFLRRPADDATANFALDLLLGKPCLIVTHHEYFRRGMEPLLRAVDALNHLEPALRWMSLEEGISTTAAVRANHHGKIDIRLFASRTHLQLGKASGAVTFARSNLTAADGIRVRLNGEAVRCYSMNGDLCFTGMPGADGNLRVELELPSFPPPPILSPPARERLKVAARRYLSELRDNYVDRSPRFRAGITAVHQLVKRHL